MIYTNHFVSIAAAMFHTILNGCNHPRRKVSLLLRTGQISIGEPVLKSGQQLLRVDGGRRYAILEGNASM